MTQKCSGFSESFFYYLTNDFFVSEATMIQFCPSLKNSLGSGPSKIFFNTQNSQLKKGCFSGQTHRCIFFIFKLLRTCNWYKCFWWSERCVTCYSLVCWELIALGAKIRPLSLRCLHFRPRGSGHFNHISVQKFWQ